MLRINQLAKELGISNHDVISALEKHLGVRGKSHSSNLSDDQVSSLRSFIEKRAKINTNITVMTKTSIDNSSQISANNIKGIKLNTTASMPLSSKTAIILKKSENLVTNNTYKNNQSASTKDSQDAISESKVDQYVKSPSVMLVKNTSEIASTNRDGFSRLRISSEPVATSKPKEPARYIQLPQKTRPKSRSNHEHSGHHNNQNKANNNHNIQRSGMPQAGKTLLPMAANTGKGSIKHEVTQTTPVQQIKRPYIPPSITELRSDSGFTRIKMADNPTPVPKKTEPARYIQLPQARRPSQQQPRSGPNSSTQQQRPRHNNSHSKINNSTPSGHRSGPQSTSRNMPILPTVVPEINTQKGIGRGGHFIGKKKDDKRAKVERMAEELELKLRQPRSRAQQIATEYVEQEIGIVLLSEGVSVKELAEKCNRPAKDVVAKLLHRGIMATINQPLDTDLAKELAREFGYLADIVTFEQDVQIMAEESREAIGEKLIRPPVVTIMGHVDHGKTSLLDAIRTSRIAESEAGGITQAIGAYHVNINTNDESERKIIFIDTPGHKAFTKMRARGAKITDIVILVVAADDGVMPQTIEAINHAKAAGVSVVVAVNKIDKQGANPDKVEKELLQYGIQVESYGGDIPCVRISAKTKEGLDVLLETLLLVADIKDLKAVYSCPAAGNILEARLDRGRGPVATVIIQCGTLKVGDFFVAGSTMGKVRAIFSDRLEKITEATPSMAVQILGFEEVPIAGDNFQVVENDSKARSIVNFRHEKAGSMAQTKQRIGLENILSSMKDDQTKKELPIIIKGDTQGSVESISNSLEQLSTDKVKVQIVHAAAGTVTENDVLLADASKASIIAFNVKVEKKVAELSQESHVEIRYYDTIYQVTEETTALMLGLLDTIKKETVHGIVEIKQIFKVNKSAIAGSFVTSGKVRSDYKARVKRDTDILWEGNIKTLRRFKDNVVEVKSGLDCGIELDGFTSVKEGDLIEVYTLEKVAATSLE